MITALKAPDMGQPPPCAWHYRVHLSKKDDWSGSAATEDEAWTKAKALRDRMVKP